MAPDGGIVLADFGIAKRLERTRAHPARELYGTPYYISPEQIEAARDDAVRHLRLGIIFHEMLTGQRPFDDSVSD
jgi:serine/threonine protein kinase